MGRVEIGLVQPFGASVASGPTFVRDLAQAAESLGFHSVWVPEHIVFFEQYESEYPYPPEPGSTERPRLPAGVRPALFDPLLTCQALAMHTTSLRVGTAVALLPLRHPLLWARQLSTLDHFAGGRVELGIGVGWLAEEFAALDVDFHARGRIADEHLAALRALWTDEVTSFHGDHVDFTEAVSLPKPLQLPGVPIHIGGESDAALRRVARFGDGWYGWNMTPAQFEHGLERLDRQLAAHPFVDGRRRSRAEVTIQVGLRFSGPLDDLAELAAAYASLGADRVLVGVPFKPAQLDERLPAIAAALGVDQ